MYRMPEIVGVDMVQCGMCIVSGFMSTVLMFQVKHGGE